MYAMWRQRLQRSVTAIKSAICSFERWGGKNEFTYFIQSIIITFQMDHFHKHFQHTNAKAAINFNHLSDKILPKRYSRFMPTHYTVLFIQVIYVILVANEVNTHILSFNVVTL